METNEKVFVIKSSKGTFYVQRMTDQWSGGDAFRLMKDRRLLFSHWSNQCDFTTADRAIFALLKHVAGLYDPANQLNLV